MLLRSMRRRTDIWRTFIDAWRCHKPAFIAEVQTRYQSDTGSINVGTGIVIDPEHFVTCAHVVHPGGLQEWSPNHNLTYRWEAEERHLKWRIEVKCGDDQSRMVTFAAPVKQIAGLDLVLLKVTKPLPGIRAPIARRWKKLPLPAIAYTFCHPSGSTLAELTEIFNFAIEARHTVIGGAPAEAMFNNGSRPGSSGSALFVESDGDPAFIGVVTRGGNASSRGSLVLAEGVDRLAAGHVDLQAGAAWAKSGDERIRRLAWDGIDPSPRTVRLPYGDDVVLIPIPAMPERGVQSPFLVAQRPVGRKVLEWCLGRPYRHADGRQRGTNVNADEIFTVLRKLGDVVGRWDLRLPKIEELSLAWATTSICRPREIGDSEPGSEPHHANGWDIHVPPCRCGEWFQPDGSVGDNILLSDSIAPQIGRASCRERV